MTSNTNQQFDDIVLMQYADGELDETTSHALEKALVTDKELLSRLKIHIKTQIDLMESQANYSLEPPQQLINLLDSLEYQESVAKQSQRHKQSSPSTTSWLASLFKPKRSGSFEVNDDGTASRKSLVSLIAPLAITAAIAVTVMNFQQTISGLTAEVNSMPSTNLEKLQESQGTYSNYGDISSDSSPLESRLDNLNNHLIAARGELQSSQQRLILATSKSQVLADELAQMRDARPEVSALKAKMEVAKAQLVTESKVAQVSQEKYDRLVSAIVERNTITTMRTLERIELLEKTTEGVAITTAVAPFIGMVKFIEFTENEIKNYCLEIDEIVTSEKEIFGEIRALKNEVLAEYNKNCLPGN